MRLRIGRLSVFFICCLAFGQSQVSYAALSEGGFVKISGDHGDHYIGRIVSLIDKKAVVRWHENGVLSLKRVPASQLVELSPSESESIASEIDSTTPTPPNTNSTD